MVASNRSDAEAEFASIPSLETVGKSIDDDGRRFRRCDGVVAAALFKHRCGRKTTDLNWQDGCYGGAMRQFSLASFLRRKGNRQW